MYICGGRDLLDCWIGRSEDLQTPQMCVLSIKVVGDDHHSDMITWYRITTIVNAYPCTLRGTEDLRRLTCLHLLRHPILRVGGGCKSIHPVSKIPPPAPISSLARSPCAEQKSPLQSRQRHLSRADGWEEIMEDARVLTSCRSCTLVPALTEILEGVYESSLG